MYDQKRDFHLQAIPLSTIAVGFSRHACTEFGDLTWGSGLDLEVGGKMWTYTSTSRDLEQTSDWATVTFVKRLLGNWRLTMVK